MSKNKQKIDLLLLHHSAPPPGPAPPSALGHPKVPCKIYPNQKLLGLRLQAVGGGLKFVSAAAAFAAAAVCCCCLLLLFAAAVAAALPPPRPKP